MDLFQRNFALSLFGMASSSLGYSSWFFRVALSLERFFSEATFLECVSFGSLLRAICSGRRNYSFPSPFCSLLVGRSLVVELIKVLLASLFLLGVSAGMWISDHRRLFLCLLVPFVLILWGLLQAHVMLGVFWFIAGATALCIMGISGEETR